MRKLATCEAARFSRSALWRIVSLMRIECCLQTQVQATSIRGSPRHIAGVAIEPIARPDFRVRRFSERTHVHSERSSDTDPHPHNAGI
jgi:hypothetical protein